MSTMIVYKYDYIVRVHILIIVYKFCHVCTNTIIDNSQVVGK